MNEQGAFGFESDCGLSQFTVVKRDGTEVPYDTLRIVNAVSKSYAADGLEPDTSVINVIVQNVSMEISMSGRMTVEDIQDRVEHHLMRYNPHVAQRYIHYRHARDKARWERMNLKGMFDPIVNVEPCELNRSNANMSAHTPAGQMMTFASELARKDAVSGRLNPLYGEQHESGEIHIHDLDYYPTKTTTCLQYDLGMLYEKGFRTKNGSVRPPQSIQSYATLATIIFQTNQNEQHGGQAIPAFDFFMAPGVRKSFHKHLAQRLIYTYQDLYGLELSEQEEERLERTIRKRLWAREVALGDGHDTQTMLDEIMRSLNMQLSSSGLHLALKESVRQTRIDTHQAMEGFLHNLNTMHSRGGNQVVFSSINYGTDTSSEGRMLMRSLLKATEEGLGKKETPIFPIQIFKLKKGISFSDADLAKALKDWQGALAGKLTFEAPNFDLFVEACRTTAHALFPNFLNLDAPFNFDSDWRADDPKRYYHEVATMGCRTRVYENVNGPRTSIGRGNLSFTSINMPRLAIEARKAAVRDAFDAGEEKIQAMAKIYFMEKLEAKARLVADQLYERYQFQRTAYAFQFPFMMTNDVWKGGGSLKPDQPVGDVIAQGTLGIGFIGGHNAMVALFGEGHGKSQKSWDTLYEALQLLNKVVNEYKTRYHLNYSVLATPAEGLSGRFTRMDRKKYGVIPGVTDRDYYVNSFHIDVRETISIQDKIRKEAPFHALTLGGHITYVELDGEAKKNSSVIALIVKSMIDNGIGYGSINHPVDTCRGCGYKGVIHDKCPVCASDQITRIRRITGYLTGNLDSWNGAKQAEERDRIKHGLREEK